MNKYEENRKNFYDAVSFKEPTKVPVGVNNFGWNFHYAGVTYKDIMNDPIKTANSYLKFFDDLEIDWAIMATLPWPIKTWKALGSKSYEFGEDGNCVNHAQVNDRYFEDTSIYDEIIEDAEKFVNETYPKFAYPAFSLPKEEAYREYINALKEYKIYMTSSELVGQGLKDRGVFSINDDLALMINSSFIKFFDCYRGIVNSLKDLRRYPDKVREAVYAIDAYKDKISIISPDTLPKENMISLTVYHAEGGFLNPKQYDDLYFNRIVEVLTPFFEKGLKHCIYGEGRHMYSLERFRKLPKGSVIIHLDEDDPFKVHKIIGDWVTVSCGITTNMLAASSKQECVDYVKKCFDTFAPGGGFVFAPSKTLCSSRDAKIENVVAVFETANELSRK